MPDIIFLDRQRKILGFFGLRGIDMGAWRYNLESKEVIAKIFQDKELARLGIAGFGLGCGDGLRTFPSMGFLCSRSRLSVTMRGNFSVEGCGKRLDLVWCPNTS
jgi:hypothetical protein